MKKIIQFFVLIWQNIKYFRLKKQLRNDIESFYKNIDPRLDPSSPYYENEYFERKKLETWLRVQSFNRTNNKRKNKLQDKLSNIYGGSRDQR